MSTLVAPTLYNGAVVARRWWLSGQVAVHLPNTPIVTMRTHAYRPCFHGLVSVGNAWMSACVLYSLEPHPATHGYCTWRDKGTEGALSGSTVVTGTWRQLGGSVQQRSSVP